jgi:hypothetical protein
MMRIFIAALAALASAPAFAQPLETPRTPQGRPDLQGYWVAEFLTPLQRPDGFGELLVRPEQEAEALKKMKPDFGEVYDPELDYFFPTTLLTVNGERRSSMLVAPDDGKLPLTALARAAIKGFKRDFDGPENRPDAERCVDSVILPPLRVFGNLAPHQIVQTPDAVVFAGEDMNPLRIVTIGADAPGVTPTREGHSRGWWEGETLVVETSQFKVDHPSGLVWRGESVITADSKVIERFRLVSADEIMFQFTIIDPALYTGPWLAEFPLHRTKLERQEYACHEANHGLIHILTAARLGKQEETKPN